MWFFSKLLCRFTSSYWLNSFLSSRVMAAGLYKQGIPNSPVTKWTHNVFTILRASTLSVFFHESLMM
jgi:hypothetical protein